MPKLRKWLKKRRYQPSFAIENISASHPKERAIDQFDAVETDHHLVPYDENLLERSRTQWQYGDWASLAALSRDTLQHHPDRAKLALLAAAGHQGLGNAAEARQHTRLAIDWGCSKKLVSQILISGVHNILGRASAVSGQDKRAIKHFECAISIVMPQTDIHLLGQTRTIRETVKLGMLPQAALLLGAELSAMKRAPAVDANRLNMFETAIELLNHELSLAQQRQQLTSTKHDTSTSKVKEYSPEWVAVLAKKSFSQLGQDLWVLEKTGYKRNGFFVEFGATDGVLLSNSWLLEKEFGWKGICAEPNPKFFSRLKINRQCTLSDHCISGSTGKQVEFIFADAYGGSKEYANDDMHSEKRAAYHAAGQVTILTTISLDDFLTELGAPRKIDYLSIDTEGSEFEILQAFPFDKWEISLLTIEHNYTSRRDEIRRVMSLNSYSCIPREFDDFFVRI